MGTRTWLGVVVVLTLIVIALAWVLFANPAPVAAPTVTPSAEGEPLAEVGDPSQPLHTRVLVTSPKSGASVGKTFTVTGKAPGNWFFEASFPIQVRDNENSKIGQPFAQAQSDWMTPELVPFTAPITVSTYSGPATLVLLRDNPSGLPENDDALEIPIVIQ